MPRKRHTPAQIIRKLRKAGVKLAKGLGVLAKTDPLDPRVLAMFGERKGVTPIERVTQGALR